jgi:hypothetical protein
MQPRNLHIDAVALAVIALVLLVFQHVPSPRFMGYPARQVRFEQSQTRFEQRMNEAAERMQVRADQMAARWNSRFCPR